jgi:formylglycine-generating enzyme required for sulfatase activity
MGIRWCADWYAADYHEKGPKKDPRGPDKGNDRVVRGGRWSLPAKGCRSAARLHHPPKTRSIMPGFRLVCVPTTPLPEW